MRLLAWAQPVDARLSMPPGSLGFWLGAFDAPTAPDLTGLAVAIDGHRASLIGPPVAFRSHSGRCAMAVAVTGRRG